MQRRSSTQYQMWLLALMLLSAAVLGFIVVRLAGGGASRSILPRQTVLGASDATASATIQTQAAAATATPRPSLPTPTFVPVVAEAPPSSPGAAPIEEQPPSAPPSTEPTAEPAPLPTASVRPAATPPPPPRVNPAPVRVVGNTTRLDDSVWQAGWKQGKPYAGRSATWIYGTTTDYHAMYAVVQVETQPRGTATLSIEGMDSEDRPKTPILITVNDVAIFRGDDPLPNDDHPLESGTWATARFPFDASLLHPGRNVITISTLVPGAFGVPPFFMLDYATLSFGDQTNAVPPQPTAIPPTAAAPTTAPPPPAASDGTATVRLEDREWQGGYPNRHGYAGRSATWIYGTDTPYNAMRATFQLAGQPHGTATLNIEGMDSEDQRKTPILITVNGIEIFRGDDPLPNDDQPLETGTWATVPIPFDAAHLQPGLNEIIIRNLARGTVNQPPFFMLDYADLVYPAP